MQTSDKTLFFYGNRGAGKSILFETYDKIMQDLLDELAEKIANEGKLSDPAEILKEAFERRKEIMKQVGSVSLLESFGFSFNLAPKKVL